MVREKMPRQRGGAAGAAVRLGADGVRNSLNWRAQLLALRFGISLECASIVAALALGGAHA